MPPLIRSAALPPTILSFPLFPDIVEAIFGAIIVSSPVLPVIVSVSAPLLNVLAVKAEKSPLSPVPMFITRFDEKH